MKDLLTLMRINNIIMAMIGVILGAFFANIPISAIFAITAATFSAALITAYGNIHNDIEDIEIDIADNKQRPLATGSFSLKKAKTFSIVFIILGNALVVNYPILLSISLSITILLFFYNRYFKRMPLIGNVSVALMVAMTFMYGNFLSIYINGVFYYDLFPFFLAFILNLSREIIKDCEDIKGDSLNNIKTLPIVIGTKKAEYLVLMLNIILILVILVSFSFSNYSNIFYIVSFITTIPIVAHAMFILVKTKNKEKSDYKKISTLYKIAMLTGLLSLFMDKL